MNSKWFAYGMTHEQADLNLLLFPFAGGCPSVFVQWKRLLCPKANVYPVLYPFREARRSEQLPDTVQYSEAAAAALALRACRAALLAEFPDAVIEAEQREISAQEGTETAAVTYIFTANIAAPP